MMPKVSRSGVSSDLASATIVYFPRAGTTYRGSRLICQLLSSISCLTLAPGISFTGFPLT